MGFITDRCLSMRSAHILFSLLCLYSISGLTILKSSKYRIYQPASRSIYMGLNDREFYTSIGSAISKVTGKAFTAECAKNIGSGGGSGASVTIVRNALNSQEEYFVKFATLAGFEMFRAEFEGIKDIYESNTIRVPKPICFGTSDYNSFVVFERVSMGGYGNPVEAGKKLAKMHKAVSPNNKYGWKMNNTIGATFQPNIWTDCWADFWDECRLGHMLRLCKMDGASFPQERELRSKVRDILESHSTQPSLVHGDLWSGNFAYTKEGDPVIFDPATYYGDREVDLAMTKLFGAQSSKFYQAYEEEFPLPEGYELRETVYNLYHILNHFVLFGSGYLTQANMMIGKILKS